MKIAILTQALYNNYGGILQNYALQTVLKRMGHNVETLDWDAYKFFFKDKDSSLYRDIKILINRILRRRFNKTSWKKKSDIWRKAQNNQVFVRKYIQKSKFLYTFDDFYSYSQKRKFDAYIVGSDQVWRPKCNQDGMLERMFLDFVADDTALKISYAASLGIDYCEFDDTQISKCSELIKRFNRVSVREDSSIALCKQIFSYDKALMVLDPTFLLNKSDYLNLINEDKDISYEGNLYSYILDNNEQLKTCISAVEQIIEAKRFCIDDINPTYYKSHKKNSTPSLVCWLAAFQKADYIICDSFHGTVFSLIFNKPFIVLGNKERGLARMESLLRMFDLHDRLILDYDATTISNTLKKQIDWPHVNETIKREKKLSIKFLIESLNIKHEK